MALRIFGKLLRAPPCLQRDTRIMLEGVKHNSSIQLSKLLGCLLHQLHECKLCETQMGRMPIPAMQLTRCLPGLLCRLCAWHTTVSTDKCRAPGKSRHAKRACRPCLHELAMSDKTPQGGSGVQLHSGSDNAGKLAGLLVGPGVQQVVCLLLVALRQTDFLRGSRLSRQPG